MENSERFIHVAQYYADCAKTGDENLTRYAKRAVILILDMEICKREVTKNPTVQIKS